MNQWQLRAAHRLDCSDSCIDCLLTFEAIQDGSVVRCDEVARAAGKAQREERLRLAREAEMRAALGVVA